ncbi:unnamed protein product [Rotaria sp. Silwood2]|nr:unnamed protein product [Rotaria sp. Silwood2]CAF3901684.1 unnamed protein product [Rotaria sp. Silwood2]
MPNISVIPLEGNNKMLKSIQYKKFQIPILGIALILGTIIAALCIVALVKINKKFYEIPDNSEKPIINSKVIQPSSDSILGASIRIDEVMSYLNELQRIATVYNGTRADSTPGFNATVDYIYNYLTANTNYKVTKSFFRVASAAIARMPILMSSINGTITNHTFAATPSTTEFYHIQYTASANFLDYVELTVIPNLGCSDDDWQKATPSSQDRVALVKRGNCTQVEKAALASKYNAAALLIYNDGEAPDRMAPMIIALEDNNNLPALFLSFQLGQKLADAARMKSGNVRILINIVRRNESTVPSTNICADTPTGDATQTIVIGSHSDSVTAGPGINDNGKFIIHIILLISLSSITGSGSAANLALAVALARLFRTSTYPKYKYRVRFCWWGAEELGLLGSAFHVKQAKNSSIIGERLSDYLINLNYDMIGSPNYIFGIYDGRSANNDTPSQALSGSSKITDLFRDWFIRQNLPWDYTDFTGRSDYGPFLAEGIVAGGLFSGAYDAKPQKQRDRYDEMLGQGLGGIAGVARDPCYHRQCDTIQNINVLGYEKMVKAAAYVLEVLGREDDLKTWLYPSIEIQRLTARSQQRSRPQYNSINEYFGLPYY